MATLDLPSARAPVLVSKGKVTNKDGIKKGFICLTNRSIIFYSDKEVRAWDYELLKATEFSFQKTWLFSSEIEIKMEKSEEATEIERFSGEFITLEGVPKREKEKVMAILKHTVSKRRRFEDEQKSKGLIRYGFGVEKWGFRKEAVDWLENYLLNRGFRKIDDAWLTKQEYLDYQQRQKGLYKYIQAGEERWGTIDEYLDGLSTAKFEEFIGLLLKIMGYVVADLPYVGDYGADLLVERGGERIVIQTKKYSLENKVGAPDVQRALGSIWHYNANEAILVTTSRFILPARNQAEGAPIDLWDRKKLKEELSQYLPSDLVQENQLKPVFVSSSWLRSLIAEHKNICKEIILKAISYSDPHLAMRIKYTFKIGKKEFGLEISGPIEYFPILGRARARRDLLLERNRRVSPKGSQGHIIRPNIFLELL